MASLSEEELESFRGKQMSAGFFTFGKPLKEGWLTKQGGRVKNWKRRWFVLKDNRLYYYKKPNDANPQGFIPLKRCVVKEAEEKKSNCFKIFDPNQPFSRNHPSFYIYADNPEELEAWIKLLNQENKTSKTTDQCPIVKEGSLTKRGGIVKNWKQRWFVLRGANLYYYKRKDDQEPLGFIPIDRASVQVTPLTKFKKNFCFEITDPSNSFNKWHQSYFIQALDEDDMNSWIEAIANVKYEEKENPEGPKKSPVNISGYSFQDNETDLSLSKNTSKGIDKEKVIQHPVELPTILVKIVRFLDSHEIKMEDFTKLHSVSSEEVEELKKAVEQEDNVDKQLEKCSSSLVVSKLLLIYLAETLPEPVCTTNLSQELLDTCLLQRESQINFIREIIHKKLPKNNLYLLQFLLAFIGRIFERSEMEVTESEDDTESTKLLHLTTVFAPLIIDISEEKSSDQTRILRGLTAVLKKIEWEETQQQEKAGAQALLQVMVLEFDKIFMSALQISRKTII